MNIAKKALASAAVAAALAGSLVFPAGAMAATHPAAMPSATAAASSCLWQYVVSDGVPNNMRIFADPNSNQVIGSIEPNQYFTSPGENFVTGQQGTRLQIDSGWVNFGDWVVLIGCS